jgi:hypothetical protein
VTVGQQTLSVSGKGGNIKWSRRVRELVSVNGAGDKLAKLLGFAETLAEKAALPSLRLAQKLGLAGLRHDALLNEEQDRLSSSGLQVLLMSGRHPRSGLRRAIAVNQNQYDQLG